MRVREAVPLLVARSVAQAVRAREIDDDTGRRDVDRGRRLVREADDRDVGLVGQRLLVRDEGGDGSPCQPRVERARRLARERVGADRDQAQLRVAEHPVERLLTGIAGRTDDADICHGLHSMHVARHLCGSWAPGARHFRLAALQRFRHASKPMLCLAVSVIDSDPRLAASRGVGIELITFSPARETSLTHRPQRVQTATETDTDRQPRRPGKGRGTVRPKDRK